MNEPDAAMQDEPDYQWQIQWWDPDAAEWSIDGPVDAATGIAYRYDSTAQALAETLLRNWSAGIDDGGRWRATVWAYEPSRPRGEPAATAEITRPATVTGRGGGSLEISPAADADEPGVGKAAARAAEVMAAAAEYGLTVTAELFHDADPDTGQWDGTVIGPAVIVEGSVTDAVVTVEGTFTPGNRQAFLEAEANAATVLGMIRMVRPGSVWGTRAASVGGLAGLNGGFVRMNKSGADVEVARHLAQVRPLTGDGSPAAPPGSGENRAAAAARPAAEFPHPPHPATPGTGGARAQQSARPRPGQQVPPRGRGRSQ
jgi:hypothetical protein